MKGFTADFASAKQHLKKVETVVHGNDLQQLLDSEPTNEDLAKTREYFFQSGVDEWYSKIPQVTFRSEFVALSKEEAQVIIRHWKNITSCSNEMHENPSELEDLAQRIDATIRNHFSTNDGVFVKLSTRSPKDSKTIFRQATTKFQDRIAAMREADSELREHSSEDNYRMVVMSEEMLQSCVVHNGNEAVTILCDSQRVAEDLMYAFEEGDGKGGEGKEGKEDYQVSIVIRAWDARITPECEFRGFVWNHQLNCLGQYWHSLYFPHLQDSQRQKQIAQDCQEFFETIKDSLPVPNAMLDLAWFGSGEVLLIEVNPLKEGLGSFKGSTGLFDFYSDASVLQGEVPFELRVRQIEETRASLISHMSLEWRRVVFGF